MLHLNPHSQASVIIMLTERRSPDAIKNPTHAMERYLPDSIRIDWKI